MALTSSPPIEQPGKSAPAVDHLRAMLRDQHDKLAGHGRGVRSGKDDPEDVHAMRVAVRRARAVLRVARPMLHRRWADSLRAELEWLGDQLGPVRDVHVLSAYLAEELATLPSLQALHGVQLLEALAEDRDQARARLLDALESDRYLRLLSALDSAATAPRVRDADVRVERLARKEFRKLRKRRRKLPKHPSAAELHKLRIRGKRARYAAELAAASRGKPAKRFIDRAKELQDVLGEHQDAVVAEDVIHDLAVRADRTEASLAAGRIIDRQRQRRREARDAFPKAWQKLERVGKRAW